MSVENKKTSWILIIPMAIFELILICVCWIIAFIHKPTAEKLVLWSIRTLPNEEWYS